MTYQNELSVPAAESTDRVQAEETALQIEELESRVAPSAVWGS
jgi:hypothetical protein